jgi:hypothetical protein
MRWRCIDCLRACSLGFVTFTVTSRHRPYLPAFKSVPVSEPLPRDLCAARNGCRLLAIAQVPCLAGVAPSRAARPACTVAHFRPAVPLQAGTGRHEAE